MKPADHWLWRLSAHQWLSAATSELAHGHDRVRARRTAITHARRAAGMALNAVLVRLKESGDPRAAHAETMWGRSYQHHLKAVADPNDPAASLLLSPAAQIHAQTLLSTPVGAGPLVRLGSDATADARSALAAAGSMLELCRAMVEAGSG